MYQFLDKMRTDCVPFLNHFIQNVDFNKKERNELLREEKSHDGKSLAGADVKTWL